MRTEIDLRSIQLRSILVWTAPYFKVYATVMSSLVIQLLIISRPRYTTCATGVRSWNLFIDNITRIVVWSWRADIHLGISVGFPFKNIFHLSEYLAVAFTMLLKTFSAVKRAEDWGWKTNENYGDEDIYASAFQIFVGTKVLADFGDVSVPKRTTNYNCNHKNHK